ncbi:MAG: bifunctional 2-C-methyl-D-erythritol 4-phosphate cytidylyltransferase/2-C-methyl-D-erythritol 2,4-cyclodiphosphate synthase [Rhodospirillales bacterium]|nr:bifunctional 2-C-methyl-D-erythritol 4-phosphate cytidylyltransferase/2-C-methyl-D-erythritol 2,4-cyclodiphosphate synthase [Rhodospirillaceae bacterium]MDP6429446.1 bifunctional 2-C-methyl-D-erythritol 4-phosphate cytidylyltransferase/2-C-methyl-D-erythritol 2,4-cyclodiphosphate synthase [Rhodospirillales bacterium]MDP6644107.1 bifunctional 2-C-methyl-D-erythritol 4-phosphate cytidylyltransferase/2-C-methyl-D-erythritol 2,4-cyclodiphosphate synthase [Rhodospirillales bacterium]MDP6843711.1 b
MSLSGGCTALLVSAGRGHRFGGETPKQYLRLGGAALIRICAVRFLGHPAVDGVIAVIHPDDRELYGRAVDGLGLPDAVDGGPERQDSVRLGLEAMTAAAPAKVLVHDAVRPFVSDAVISAVIGAIDGETGAIPALAVTDTLKRGDQGRIKETVPRQDLWRAQTPQGFPYAPFLAAHRAAEGMMLTDDAAVAEAHGLAVAMVAGEEDNFKITGPEDMRRAERLQQGHGISRTGLGFDVHRFSSGRPLILGGVEIPHDLGLEGHSDADVALHAIVDALLGAVGAGDIGVYFPPADAEWQNAPSHIFLKAAGDAVAAAGGTIRGIDLTIICEAPKIGPHRDAMRRKIAEILQIHETLVNVKATTTERLGFTGRGEGIAAQAVASVEISSE